MVLSMCIDYIFECTACSHKWELYGDGLIVVNLSNFDIRCSKCGCQILIVINTNAPDEKPNQIDFTEQNITLSKEKEFNFNEMKTAFSKLNMLTEKSDEYVELKNWILERIK